jgi:hypothetical protein
MLAGRKLGSCLREGVRDSALLPCKVSEDERDMFFRNTGRPNRLQDCMTSQPRRSLSIFPSWKSPIAYGWFYIVIKMCAYYYIKWTKLTLPLFKALTAAWWLDLLANFHLSDTLRRLVWLPERGISPLEGLCLHGHIHASNGIRSNDPSIRAVKTHALDRAATANGRQCRSYL